MGVKDLWNILSPLCERKPMFELQGKTVAIDLSCWVVDSQMVTDNSMQPKMYLRNLYFRTAFLLMQGILPVFVLEGKAPTLKHNTIAKRNDIRHPFRERKTSRKAGRSQFNRILNECRKMLDYMGLACVQGHGEAEAMCAYLNRDGLVDGCISQDSDCFLYGAKVVYRNFCTSAQGNRGGTGGAVDEYSMEKIEKILNLGRNKMIALALLCGCDYNDGLNGVGKEAAMKFFRIVEDKDVLDRIQNWRTDNSLDQKEYELLYSNICSSCGHSGKVQKHAKSGCLECGTAKKCNEAFKETRALLLNEIALRKKALLSDDFPNQELIDEFLVRKDSVPSKLDLQWKQPQIDQFIDFMERNLSWEPQYVFEKIFPLATRWQLIHLPGITNEKRLLMPGLFIPDEIKKIRNIRSVASYEIIWKMEHYIIKKLKEYTALDKENDSANGEDTMSELTSIEPQGAVLECYPELVEAFETARNAKSRKRTNKKKASKIPNDNPDGHNNDKVIQRQKTQRRKNGNVEGNRKIDDFISTNRPLSLEESFEQMCITPKRAKAENTPKRDLSEVKNQHENSQKKKAHIKRGPQFDRVLSIEKLNLKLNNTLDRIFNELSPDDFVSDNDDNDLNMTGIIEGICSKQTFQFSMFQDAHTSENKKDSDVSTSTDSVHKIEKSFTLEKPCDIIESNSICDESVDEFDEISEFYVPLNQRILNHKNPKKLNDILKKQEKNKHSLGIDDLMNDTDCNESVQLEI